MEKKLRIKFIIVSMYSLAVVLLILFGSINLFNFMSVTESLDRMLNSIAYNNHVDMPNPPPDKNPRLPQEQSMAHFFVVELNQNGQIIHIVNDEKLALTDENIKDYSDRLKASSKISGYLEEYRYLIYVDNEGTKQIFLNCSNEFQFERTLLLLSLLISLICFAIMFILVFFLSKLAIKPIIKNMQIQKRFITDASHELKTPLTSISTSADILTLDNKDNEWIKNIRTQTFKMSKLVTNLVTMSRLDEEIPIPEKCNFSLSDALWESVEPFSGIAMAKGKKFEIKIKEGLTIYGDVVSIQQMISILLDNSIKYSDDKGYIRIDAYRLKQKIVIEVFNTCNKIETKNLDRLFDRFYRDDESRSSKTGSTGVGLSIAKGIAKAHSGDITVESKSGNSICFTVKL